MPINLDHITELEDSSVFKIESKGNRPMDFDPTLIALVRFEMNLDLKIIERTGYTFLDYLSDIGGI